MKAKFFTLAIISMMATTILSTTSCDDDEDEPIVTPVTTDSTSTTEPVKIIQRTIHFEGINLDNIVVNDNTELKTLKDKLPATTDEYKVLSLTINNEELTDDVIEKTIITSDITIAVKALQYTKAPTLEQLKAQNLTDEYETEYYDLANMKYYGLYKKDKTKYTDISDLTYENDTLTYSIAYTETFSMDFHHILCYVDGKVKKVGYEYDTETEGEIFTTWKNKKYGETLIINTDGSIKYTIADPETTREYIGTYEIKNDAIEIKYYQEGYETEFDIITLYYNGKKLQNVTDYFKVAEISAPTAPKE